MRVGRFTNITCIQTLAGFQKILGRKNFSPQELRVVFQDNREDCEALANLLYDATRWWASWERVSFGQGVVVPSTADGRSRAGR